MDVAGWVVALAAGGEKVTILVEQVGVKKTSLISG